MLAELARRWSEIADRHPRPPVGATVRVRGRDIVGVVVLDFPLTVRDGRGFEHEITTFEVRL